MPSSTTGSTQSKLLTPPFLTYGCWPLLLSYSGGLICAAWELNGPQLIYSIIALTLLSLIGRHQLPQQLHNLPLWLGLLALGVVNYTQALHPEATNLDSLLGDGALTIRGQVIRIDPQPDRWRMDINLRQLSHKDQQAAATGRIRIQVGDDSTPPQPGDIIVCRTKLRKPRRFGLPGEFNYPRHLANAGIRYTGYLTHGDDIAILYQPHSIWTTRPAITIERWRHQLGQVISQQLPIDNHAHLLSLTLGEKSRLSSDQRQRLARLGLSHLFSISGLHLGLLAAMLYLLINNLYRRSSRLLLWQPAQTIVPLLTLPGLFFYLLLSGGALPTLRATVLTGLAALIVWRQRHTPPIQLLGLVALIILTVKPLALFSASFQLSFCGVAALMLCLPRWQQRFDHRWQRWLILPMVSTTVATLATAPVALWHFHLLAPAALLSNLIAIPIIGLVTLPLALIGTILFSINPICGQIPLRLANQLINSCLTLADHLDSVPLTAHQLYLSPIEHLQIATVCLIALLLTAGARRAARHLTGIAMLTLAFYTIVAPPVAPLRLTTFSVGQGESLLLQRGAENYLIDGGGLYSPTFDVGERLLAPSLGQLGVHHLDAVILSHDHPDHRKGLIYILRHFSVEQFWCSVPRDQLHSSLQHVLAEKNIEIRVFNGGWTTIDQPPRRFHVFLSPQPSNMNNQSLVIYAAIGNDGLLLCGDLEKGGVQQLLQHPVPGPVQLLKLPHHGSRHSHPQQLLKQLAPHWAVASVGYGNRYRFPNQAVIDAVKEIDAQLIRTDRDGTVQFTSHGQGWQQRPLASPLPWP